MKQPPMQNGSQVPTSNNNNSSNIPNSSNSSNNNNNNNSNSTPNSNNNSNNNNNNSNNTMPNNNVLIQGNQKSINTVPVNKGNNVNNVNNNSNNSIPVPALNPNSNPNGISNSNPNPNLNPNANPNSNPNHIANQSLVNEPVVRDSAAANSKELLNAYIYDFLLKSGYNSSAASFLNEANVPVIKNNEKIFDKFQLMNSKQGLLPKSKMTMNTPEGFIYEWWHIFWDIFNARTDRGSSQNASNYYNLISTKDKHDSLMQMNLQSSFSQNNMYNSQHHQPSLHHHQQQQQPQQQQVPHPQVPHPQGAMYHSQQQVLHSQVPHPQQQGPQQGPSLPPQQLPPQQPYSQQQAYNQQHQQPGYHIQHPNQQGQPINTPHGYQPHEMQNVASSGAWNQRKQGNHRLLQNQGIPPQTLSQGSPHGIQQLPNDLPPNVRTPGIPSSNDNDFARPQQQRVSTGPQPPPYLTDPNASYINPNSSFTSKNGVSPHSQSNQNYNQQPYNNHANQSPNFNYRSSPQGPVPQGPVSPGKIPPDQSIPSNQIPNGQMQYQNIQRKIIQNQQQNRNYANATSPYMMKNESIPLSLQQQHLQQQQDQQLHSQQPNKRPRTDSSMMSPTTFTSFSRPQSQAPTPANSFDQPPPLQPQQPLYMNQQVPNGYVKKNYPNEGVKEYGENLRLLESENRKRLQDMNTNSNQNSGSNMSSNSKDNNSSKNETNSQFAEFSNMLGQLQQNISSKPSRNNEPSPNSGKKSTNGGTPNDSGANGRKKPRKSRKNSISVSVPVTPATPNNPTTPQTGKVLSPNGSIIASSASSNTTKRTKKKTSSSVTTPIIKEDATTPLESVKEGVTTDSNNDKSSIPPPGDNKRIRKGRTTKKAAADKPATKGAAKKNAKAGTKAGETDPQQPATNTGGFGIEDDPHLLGDLNVSEQFFDFGLYTAEDNSEMLPDFWSDNVERNGI